MISLLQLRLAVELAKSRKGPLGWTAKESLGNKKGSPEPHSHFSALAPGSPAVLTLGD